ncbi:MAG: hypothetical protein PVI30_10255 [Myxococcales bacterium]|jgi:hypothetical protein
MTVRRLLDRIADEAEALRGLGEELDRQLDALREGAREELEEVEWRVHHLENDVRRMAGELRDPARDVARAARELADELRRGCERIRG